MDSTKIKMPEAMMKNPELMIDEICKSGELEECDVMYRRAIAGLETTVKFVRTTQAFFLAYELAPRSKRRGRAGPRPPLL